MLSYAPFLKKVIFVIFNYSTSYAVENGQSDIIQSGRRNFKRRKTPKSHFYPEMTYELKLSGNRDLKSVYTFA